VDEAPAPVLVSLYRLLSVAAAAPAEPGETSRTTKKETVDDDRELVDLTDGLGLV
jgi:hypothetical protein